MNGLDHECKAGRLGVPALDCRSFVLDRNWVERGVRDRRHHVNLWGDLRERRVQSHLDVERSRRNRQLERHTMLLIHLRLTIKDNVGVELAELVDLNVRHCLVTVHHLLTWLIDGVFLSR